jgi:hypothetical protein
VGRRTDAAETGIQAEEDHTEIREDAADDNQVVQVRRRHLYVSVKRCKGDTHACKMDQ